MLRERAGSASNPEQGLSGCLSTWQHLQAFRSEVRPFLVFAPSFWHTGRVTKTSLVLYHSLILDQGNGGLEQEAQSAIQHWGRGRWWKMGCTQFFVCGSSRRAASTQLDQSAIVRVLTHSLSSGVDGSFYRKYESKPKDIIQAEKMCVVPTRIRPLGGLLRPEHVWCFRSMMCLHSSTPECESSHSIILTKIWPVW